MDYIKLSAEFDVYFLKGDQEIANRDAKIHEMYVSRSWRLTQPVRVLERLVRGRDEKKP
jgi:hypothetical protein